MKRNMFLICLVLIIIILPYVINPNAEFGGADGIAEETIKKMNPDIKPWFRPLWEPPGEIESLLFALQAAVGSGFICYYLGYLVGKKKGMEQGS